MPPRSTVAVAGFELFALHGFYRVTVAEIARRADVSVATVFNHFRTKEELICRPLEEYEAALVAAVRDRPPGSPSSTRSPRFSCDRRASWPTRIPTRGSA